jgi:hypothetical protein
MLQHLATSTGGRYIHTSDADRLTTVKDIIVAGMESSYVVEEVNGEPRLLIADSGFRADVDGFGFYNYLVSQRQGGSCLGMSRMARDVFLGQFAYEYSQPDWPTITTTSTNRARLSSGNVYPSTAMTGPYLWGTQLRVPEDWSVLDNNKMPMLNPKYEQPMIDAGFDTDPGGFSFLYGRLVPPLLDLKNAQVSADYVDDYQLLQIATMYYGLGDSQSAAQSILELLRYKTKNLTMTLSPTELDRGTKQIASGVPVLLIAVTYGAVHALLGTSIYYDVASGDYYITVYDSNTPGETQVATLTRIAGYGEWHPGPTYLFSYDSGDYVYDFAFVV